MDIGLLLRRWIDVLAATYFAQRETWRARRALVVSSQGGQFIIRKALADEDGTVRLQQPDSRSAGAVLATVAAGERLPAEVLHAAQRGVVLLQLPVENVALRRLSVPAQARDFVAGIVHNQIERLSPWQPDEAIYGFETAIDAQDAGTLEVRVLIDGSAGQAHFGVMYSFSKLKAIELENIRSLANTAALKRTNKQPGKYVPIF